MKTRPVSGALLVLPLVLGCALSPSGERRNSRDVITAEDIATTTAHTAYDVVQRLQAQWLNARGNASLGSDETGQARDSSAPVPDVVINGVEVGGIENLRRILATDVAEMRYLNPGEAGVRYGMGHPRGIISVTLK